MMNFKGRILGTSAAGWLAAAVLAGAGAAHANPEMGGDHCRAGDRHGMEMGGMGMMGHGMYGMQPHNAAAHFLEMGPALKLTADQTKQLTKLRDEYIDKNATAEEQLKAARADLGKLLFADEVDMSAVDSKFEKIGKLDSQLWHAYAQQLHDIKALLTDEQKQDLKSLWEGGHRGMGEMHEDMPLHRDAMPPHRDM